MCSIHLFIANAVRVSKQSTVVLAPGWHHHPAMDYSILFALNWNSLGQLASEDLEQVLHSMAQTTEKGKDEPCSAYGGILPAQSHNQ